MLYRFEFHSYNENAEFIGMHVEDHRSVTCARNAAGRLAKQQGGPVDLCWSMKTAGPAAVEKAVDAPWDERYITTASPSEHHVTGYRFERLT